MRCHRWPEVQTLATRTRTPTPSPTPDLNPAQVQTLVERMHASVVGKMEEHRDEPARKKATKQGERIFAAHRANEEAKSLAPQP